MTHAVPEVAADPHPPHPRRAGDVQRNGRNGRRWARLAASFLPGLLIYLFSTLRGPTMRLSCFSTGAHGFVIQAIESRSEKQPYKRNVCACASPGCPCAHVCARAGVRLPSVRRSPLSPESLGMGAGWAMIGDVCSIAVILLRLRNQALDFSLNAAVAVKLLCSAWF